MSAQPHPSLTEEEYLKIERAAAFKSEYYDGRMYAMSGGSYPHGQIIPNLAAELRQALRGKGCSVTTSEVRIRVSPRGFYTYPDIAVVSGPPKFADDQADTLLNRTLLVEVLSPSTEAHDRGFKFAQCRQLESLQEYTLVSQTEPRVEIFRRQAPGEWLLSEASGLDATCRFDSVGCRVPLAEIYYQVSFGDEDLPTDA
ncbi:MAG TPA: Uma2 family endonuclease [Bryobacteraceae bacterium]|nr:Uma2 family endonuclease [Bryobacteraceae bacterium]